MSFDFVHLDHYRLKVKREPQIEAAAQRRGTFPLDDIESTWIDGSAQSDSKPDIAGEVLSPRTEPLNQEN